MKDHKILNLQLKNNAFYIHFKIVDIENEETQDRTLAPLAINDETIYYGHNNGNLISKLREALAL